MIYGFCSGTFHIVHSGHIRFIRECRSRCDHLTVMIANDVEIFNKSGCIPKISLEDRKSVFSEFKSIDRLLISPYNTKPSWDEFFSDISASVMNYPVIGFSIPYITYFVNEDVDDYDDRSMAAMKHGFNVEQLSRKNNDSGNSTSKILSNFSKVFITRCCKGRVVFNYSFPAGYFYLDSYYVYDLSYLHQCPFCFSKEFI